MQGLLNVRSQSQQRSFCFAISIRDTDCWLMVLDFQKHFTWSTSGIFLRSLHHNSQFVVRRVDPHCRIWLPGGITHSLVMWSGSQKTHWLAKLFAVILTSQWEVDTTAKSCGRHDQVRGSQLVVSHTATANLLQVILQKVAGSLMLWQQLPPVKFLEVRYHVVIHEWCNGPR